MATRKPKETKEQKAKYVPGKNYEWKADDDFVIKGWEVEKIQRAFTALAGDQAFQRHATLYEGMLTFQKFFEEAVEDGLIVEKKEEAPPEEIEAE